MKTIHRILVVGSGPAGWYSVEALLPLVQEGRVAVDVVDSNLAPNGLVRYGVAPDHADMRAVEAKFASWAQSGGPGLRWFGGVHLSSLAHVRNRYSAVLLCHGAQREKALEIPGAEDAEGVVPAGRLVSFYNALPCLSDPAVSSESAHFDAEGLLQEGCMPCVVGMGNVALDVARIMLRDPCQLERTDISSPALRRIVSCATSSVHLVARRGAAHAAFTAKEFRELLTFPGTRVVVKEEDLRLAQQDPASQELLAGSRRHQRLFELLQRASNDPELRTAGEKRLFLHFNRTPLSVLSDSRGRVSALRTSLSHSPSSPPDDIPCSLLVPSIGFAPVPLAGVPLVPSRAHVAHSAGRVEGLPGVYVAGWLKRGPQGVIADNRWDAQETVGSLVEDLPSLLKPPWVSQADDPLHCFPDKIDFSEWLRLDRVEIQRGQAVGKPREKFTSIAEMRQVLQDEDDADDL